MREGGKEGGSERERERGGEKEGEAGGEGGMEGGREGEHLLVFSLSCFIMFLHIKYINMSCINIPMAYQWLYITHIKST